MSKTWWLFWLLAAEGAAKTKKRKKEIRKDIENLNSYYEDISKQGE
jgi:hypothetical protein